MADLPNRRLFMHVGLPKTGTTQLQGVLWANRRRLQKRGVLYPGKRVAAHWLAARDLLGGKGEDVEGRWAALVDEVAASTAPSVVVSHEMFAGLRGRQVRRAVADFPGREVHMVVTVRDFSRIVAATWQERAKNREIESWPEYLDAVAAGPEGRHGFWRLQDAPRVLKSWSRAIPPERIHVVTVPSLSTDRTLLLRRFAEAVDIDPDRLRVPADEANQSIGAVEIAVLQRVNAAAADLDMDTYRLLVKRHLVQKVLARRPGQLRVVLPESSRPWVDAETERIASTVEQLGCNVVGTLDDLEPTAIGAGDDARLTEAPEQVPVDAVLDASSEVVVELLSEVHRFKQAARATAGPTRAGARQEWLERLARRGR